MSSTSEASFQDQEDAEDASIRPHDWTSNPIGRNQHPNCPSKNSDAFLNLLKEYHKITTSRSEVKALLERRHNIYISERTIGRRWRDMGLKGSRATEASMPRGDVVQLVVAHMEEDVAGTLGKGALKKQIALRTGVHLKRKTVGEIQSMVDPVAALARHPTSRQIRRVQLISRGPNEVWCCDGHDKLSKYGFGMWGIRDKFSRKWLGLWVLPNNRIGGVVAFLWLSLVHKLGGIPRQTSSDCGTENLEIAGFAGALQETLTRAGDEAPPAHIFLRSVHHIPIECGWLDLRRALGYNLQIHWERGNNVYKLNDPIHQTLVRWLWPPVIQKELDRFCDEANNKRVRKQKNKVLPSGVSPNISYTFPERFEGEDCLQPIDRNLVQAMLDSERMRPEKRLATDWGVPDSFALRAQDAMRRLHIEEVTLPTIWITFSALLPFVSDTW